MAQLQTQVQALSAGNAAPRADVAALQGPDGAGGGGAGPGTGTAASPLPRKRPPAWVKANVVVVARHRPRRRRDPAPGRRRDVPDRIVVHAPSVCPACAAPLDRGRLVRRRQVIDLPPVRAEVVDHRLLERTCRRCGTRCRRAMPDSGETVGGQRRVPWPVAACVAALRTKLRLPLAQVKWLLDRVWGLRLSVGELSTVLADAARGAASLRSAARGVPSQSRCPCRRDQLARERPHRLGLDADHRDLSPGPLRAPPGRGGGRVPAG